MCGNGYYSNTNTYPNPNNHTYPNTDANNHSHINAGSITYTDPHIHGDTNPDGYCYTYCYS